MEETLIEFETAKLAKEKGFDVFCENIYPIEEFINYDRGCADTYKKGICYRYTTMDKEPLIYAPTQSLLQKYLREEHGLFSYIDWSTQEVVIVDYKNHPGKELLRKGMSEFLPDYEHSCDVLDRLLQVSLKLINNK